jgi:hypothetical protein
MKAMDSSDPSARAMRARRQLLIQFSLNLFLTFSHINQSQCSQSLAFSRNKVCGERKSAVEGNAWWVNNTSRDDFSFAISKTKSFLRMHFYLSNLFLYQDEQHVSDMPSFFC